MKWIKRIGLGLLILLGLIGIYAIINFFGDRSPKKQVSSTVLLERVEKVVKLVTVEGSFSEIYDYKHHYLADIWPFRKKALVRINAKVLVGYDFDKMSIHVDDRLRLLTVESLPPPEIVSIEHDMDYYNFENGLFNMITNKDITEMGFEAKDFITDKAEESDLFEQAEDQRKQLFEVLALAIEASGWKLVVKESKGAIKG